MNDYAQMRVDQDRDSYLTDKLKNRKQIFKNYIDNNSNIRRREI